MSQRSHLEQLFSVFLSDGGAHKTSWGPGKFSVPFSTSLSLAAEKHVPALARPLLRH